jgi:pantoate ligase/cytidylate kinase
MVICPSIAELRTVLQGHRHQQKTIGLVPTMGALHAGHRSLIATARRSVDVVVVSIFVNPLQFAPTEDLATYPRTLEADAKLCEELGVDVLFTPTPEEIHGENLGSSAALGETFQVIPSRSLTANLCGKFRPGFFTGIATVVTKLFTIVAPDHAFFGQKDAQQVAVIRALIQSLHFPITLHSCPTQRSRSGLAHSSRNQYLDQAQLALAQEIYQGLIEVQRHLWQGQTTTSSLLNTFTTHLDKFADFTIQYAEIVDPARCEPIPQVFSNALCAVACYLGDTRLIDNIMLTARPPLIAIDGPAGAGKSTVTRLVAQKLGILYLDTGAMYRGITWFVLEQGLAVDDRDEIATLIKTVELELIPSPDPTASVQVKINGQDITTAIRTPRISNNVSAIAAQPAVRAKLVQQQQQWAAKGGLIAEGRDIGSKVFPQADLKIFLTASVEERARRRFEELTNQGEQSVTLEQLQQEIAQRDHLDSTRAESPLIRADDAIEVVTDDLTIEEVVTTIISHLI